MGVKISTVIIGSIDIDVDALKKIEGVTIFISSDDVVFIISDGREVYYAEKFFARIMPLKIFLVTEAQAADNKNLRDVLIQLSAQDFKQKAYEVTNMINDIVNVDGIVGLDFADVKSVLKNSGQAVATIGEGTSVEEAVNNAIEGHDIKSSRAVLINFKATKDAASMSEFESAISKIKSSVNKNAEIIWGVTVDESFGDKVKVAVIATKFID